MTTITNKQLFVTMIVIGVITIVTIIGTHTRGSSLGSYSLRNSLSATAFQDYPSYQYSYPTDNIGYSDNYNTNVDIYTTPIKTNTGTTTTTTYTYYQKDSSQYSQNTSTYYDYTGYNVPAGCESGTDYSTVTNQPCG